MPPLKDQLVTDDTGNVKVAPPINPIGVGPSPEQRAHKALVNIERVGAMIARTETLRVTGATIMGEVRIIREALKLPAI